ncbi:MAG TPA: alpha/beta hydrolase [Rhizomicrobium sp.]|jgi:pimeloyl-ACP methyl ester carboxylesterase|nr:alpha/beta hydrolase [Rhizomicrobium sp.]
MRWILILIVAILALLGVGAYLLSAPDIPRAVLEAKYATPPSQFVELSYASTLPPASGVSDTRATDPNVTARAHYRVRGPVDAPVLLLLHGSNASLFTWEPWSKTLSDHFRVVSVDLPGHGLTGATANHDYTAAGMVNFVAAFADKLGLKSFALAGNSMGGGVAARFAETYPARVSALILVDAGGMPTKMGDHVPIAFKLLRQSWAQSLLAHLNPRPLVREGLNDAIVHKAVLTEKMIDLYTDMALLEGSRQATFERFNQFGGGDANYVKDHVGALKMPVLILWGEEDHLIPVAAAHLWNKALPGSKLIVYPATGHIPMEEVADRSATDVRAFLAGRP